MHSSLIKKFINSKNSLLPIVHSQTPHKIEGEGGCGVIGIACTDRIAGKYLLPALRHMRNRGNGKGGGIAAVGLSAETLGVSQQILENNYLLAIAYLDQGCQFEVENSYIHPLFDIDHIYSMPHVENFKTIEGLDILPPKAILYFVRVKEKAIQHFQKNHDLDQLSSQAIEDEIVYQNSYHLNRTFYAAIGEKKAFVLSHGKNILVLKMVGYGDDVIRYYQLENFKAHVWIGHHRYPTKGKVWHPGGAHPFVGLNEALVHNGDFANYFSICEYLAQRNIHPLFLTDTEVSVLIFDLLHRTYRYPLEYVIEALAPTTERDFTLLPEKKKRIYQLLQDTHIHGSPDGPWFFLIAQSLLNPQNPSSRVYSLLGITDTSMLRPQVFALQKGEASIGLAASEKQAIDIYLQSLAEEDKRFWSCADYYWNARGGSYTDGGAFIFNVYPETNGKAKLICTNKFGHPVHAEEHLKSPYFSKKFPESQQKFPDLPAFELVKWVKENLSKWDYELFNAFLNDLNCTAITDQSRQRAIEVITKLLNQPYPLEYMRSSVFLDLCNKNLIKLFESIEAASTVAYAYLSFNGVRPQLQADSQTLIIDARGFPAQGKCSLALEIIEMYKHGFKNFIIFACQGQRFIANGLGPNSGQARIDVYGSSGDYLASGIDGAEIHVHGTAQDQVAQIMKDGSLIIHGDVGQTFMYGAKGGKAFVRGHTAGRPAIYAVGKPRIVINGTCLDYLAEAFMAGDPLKEGGFVIINGLTFDQKGQIKELDTPYPGSNLFSLASGGAIYVRDPGLKITKDQLNGGEFTDMQLNDWKLILPYLEENARHFDIPLSRLLEYENQTLDFQQVYRKISPSRVKVLQEEEAWVKVRD